VRLNIPDDDVVDTIEFLLRLVAGITHGDKSRLHKFRADETFQYSITVHSQQRDLAFATLGRFAVKIVKMIWIGIAVILYTATSDAHGHGQFSKNFCVIPYTKGFRIKLYVSAS